MDKHQEADELGMTPEMEDKYGSIVSGKKYFREIRIILDTSDPHNPVFVEIENNKGESINIGKWVEKENGLHEIQIQGIFQDNRSEP